MYCTDQQICLCHQQLCSRSMHLAPHPHTPHTAAPTAQHARYAAIDPVGYVSGQQHAQSDQYGHDHVYIRVGSMGRSMGRCVQIAPVVLLFLTKQPLPG
jgi:hypothetical protein